MIENVIVAIVIVASVVAFVIDYLRVRSWAKKANGLHLDMHLVPSWGDVNSMNKHRIEEIINLGARVSVLEECLEDSVVIDAVEVIYSEDKEKKKGKKCSTKKA